MTAYPAASMMAVVRIGTTRRYLPLRNVVIAADRLGIQADEYRRQLEAGQKWCTGHKSWHSRDLFGVRRSSLDGLDRVCAEFNRNRAREGMRRLYASRRSA